jgi:hypothetical protein
VVGKVIVAKAIGINILYIRTIRFVIHGKKRVKRREIIIYSLRILTMSPNGPKQDST